MKSLFVKNVFLFLFGVLLFGGSCNKDDDLDWTDARILDSGSEAVDGCGILVVVGENNHSPVYIEDKYAQSGLEIRVKYRLLDDYKRCGFGDVNSIQKIDITQIKRK